MINIKQYEIYVNVAVKLTPTESEGSFLTYMMYLLFTVILFFFYKTGIIKIFFSRRR